MPISRGQTPRQLYGLGSFVKSIGKAAKKVVKAATSPVGLATIAGIGLTGGLGPTGFLRSKALPFLMGVPQGSPGTPGTPGLLGKLGILKGKGSFMPTATAGVLGASLLGGMFTAQEQEEIESLRESGDSDKLAGYLRRGYRNLNPNADQIEVENFVRANLARGGSPEENAMQASGIMGLPLNENPAGVTELDLRESGGFIPPVGVKEKADDIPAMLSNNEFVFTADAVRGMGDGNVNLGAQRMYDMMKKLENGGRV
jgi:hypothetical protein